MDANTVFNTSGKIPTESKFWAQDDKTFLTETGITKYFSKVLAEQVFLPVKKPQIAFYDAFAGRPLDSGAGWTERILKKTVAKKYKPKADAEDDLKFYDSDGYEWTFGLNVKGWRPVTLPSELESLEEFISANGAGVLNSKLVENVLMDYQRDMESEIQMKLISTCGSHIEVNPDDAVGIVRKINETVTRMRGTKYHFNDVTTYEETEEIINDNIYTNSDEVLVFMSEEFYAFLEESFASLPSPEKLIIKGKLILLVDDLPAAITTKQWEQGQTDQGWDSSIEPVAIDTDAPLAFICSAKRCEYRPYVGSYKMNLSKNGAGDFVNQHLIWKGSIAIRPWENAVRIMADAQLTDITPTNYVKVINNGKEPIPSEITNGTDNPVPASIITDTDNPVLTKVTNPDAEPIPTKTITP